MNAMQGSKLRLQAAAWTLLVIVCCGGCLVQPPGGSPVEPMMLGSMVDEVNRQQEENAEAAKFVVYSHEFEINVPLTHPNGAVSDSTGFEFMAPERIRGFRLTPYGQDHVAQIAQQLLMDQQAGATDWHAWDVIVERSETSKVWDTRHHYPVHFNPELDEARRQTIVAALDRFGVVGADEIVVVAPAFSEGQDANEAAAAYGASRQAFNNNNNNNSNFGSGRGF